MDTLLLGITIVSLVVALVMSVTAWRVMRDEKKRSAARVAALTLASSTDASAQEPAASQAAPASPLRPARKAPWAPPPSTLPTARPAALGTHAAIVSPAEIPLNHVSIEPVRPAEPTISHASGFLGATPTEPGTGSRQKTLAVAAVILFAVTVGGLGWISSRSEGATAASVTHGSPLELVSLSHQRQNDKLAVSGLVRNPAAGQPIQKLSAVVFLFDRTGTFVTSSTANVDFLRLGAGDESPFVVSLDAPATVSRYRVSFRTDDGVVPHIDRRGANPAPAENDQTVNVKLK